MSKRNARSISIYLVGAIVLAAGWAGKSAAQPSDYPNRPLRIVVTYPAGSGSDQLARPIAQKLGDQLGKNVLVENRLGGGTVIGMNVVAKAAPDGYTLLAATTSLVITPGLYKLPFDPVKDFAPIVLIGSAPLLLLTNAQNDINNVRDLIAAARAKPGGLNYASSGVGGALHLGMELLNSMAGVKITHVPYKGSSQALQALLSGDVQVELNTFDLSVLSQVTSGRLRALGVTGQTRMESQSQFPTIAEAGIPGYEVSSWHGLLAPAQTPAPILARLEAEGNKALQDPKLREYLTGRGIQIANKGAAPFADYIAKELEKWTPLVKASGARAD